MGKINVFNASDRVLSDHVNGVQIIIKPRQGAIITEKQAKALMSRHPDLQTNKVVKYTDDDYALLANLKKGDLLEFATNIMKGIATETVAEFTARKEREVELARADFIREEERKKANN